MNRTWISSKLGIEGGLNHILTPRVCVGDVQTPWIVPKPAVAGSYERRLGPGSRVQLGVLVTDRSQRKARIDKYVDEDGLFVGCLARCPRVFSNGSLPGHHPELETDRVRRFESCSTVRCRGGGNRPDFRTKLVNRTAWFLLGVRCQTQAVGCISPFPSEGCLRASRSPDVPRCGRIWSNGREDCSSLEHTSHDSGAAYSEGARA